jgi:hypothetical protein
MAGCPDGGVADPWGAREKAVVAGWSVKDALRSRPFLLLYVGLIFTSVGAFVPFVHLIPYAEDQGISHTVAVAIFSILGLGSVAGRLAVGGLADRVGRGLSLVAVIFGIFAMLMWWLIADGVWQLAIFALVFGSCWGGFVALYPVTDGRLFWRTQRQRHHWYPVHGWGHRHARRAEARRRWLRSLRPLFIADPRQRRLRLCCSMLHIAVAEANRTLGIDRLTAGKNGFPAPSSASGGGSEKCGSSFLTESSPHFSGLRRCSHQHECSCS